jgi:phosphoenolpyruvate-protein kinase (PTS system EI component)
MRPHGGVVGGEGSTERSGGEGNPALVLVARDLGPADFAEIELEGLRVGGIALADGSVTSHAAIMARSLGVPLVVGLGDAVLALPAGETVVLDGTAGILTAAPTSETLRDALAAVDQHQERRVRLAQERAVPASTLDGHPVRLLVNASTEREVLAGLEAGAEGVGLLRTEFHFLDAADWPTAAMHATAVLPVLRHLAGRVATVRTLDFGADKTPPFLRGRSERGVALHLTAPDALAEQLRGLLQAAADTGAVLRIMLPLVEDVGQLQAARGLLMAAHAALGLGTPVPALGAMIETRAAVANIDALAAAADFLSIGTNDLVQDVLGLDRLGQAATVNMAADPRVLHAIRAVTAAAGRHQRSVEVCGEAAGVPRIALLLVGLGVGELSVAPPRLDEVRTAVRAITLAALTALAETALCLDSADAVLALAAQVLRGTDTTRQAE